MRPAGERRERERERDQTETTHALHWVWVQSTVEAEGLRRGSLMFYDTSLPLS